MNNQRANREQRTEFAAMETTELENTGLNSRNRRPQLELELAGSVCRSTNRQRRLSRANWWFQRMRKVVDLACDWSPAPQARPQQTWFENVRSEHALAPRLEERQVVE